MPASAPTPGGRIGRYILQAELGRGGMGIVYRAFDGALARPVAIKMIHGAGFEDADAAERFIREARVAARLRHPGLVAIHDVGSHAGQPYIAMDFVDGESLDALLSRGAISRDDFVRVMGDVAEAIAVAHEAGIVHRDVKPGNILVDRQDGRGRLTDFGLARDTTRTRGITLTGEVVGTPAYMAPEQALGTSDVPTPSMDVWAIGAVLWRGLAGRPPFEGVNALAVLNQVVSGIERRPREVDPTVPEELDAIAMHCLEREPADRYASARHVADDLARWLAGRSVSVRPPGRVDRFLRRARGRVVPVVAGALALVATAAAIGGWGAAAREGSRARDARAGAVAADSKRQAAESARETAEVARRRAEAALQTAEAALRTAAEERELASATGSGNPSAEARTIEAVRWLARGELHLDRSRPHRAWRSFAEAIELVPRADIVSRLFRVRSSAPWLAFVSSGLDPGGAGARLDLRRSIAVTTGSRDLTVWDLRRSAATAVLEGPPAGYATAVVSPDERHVAASHRGGDRVDVWRIADRILVGRLELDGLDARGPFEVGFRGRDELVLLSPGARASIARLDQLTTKLSRLDWEIPAGARLLAVDPTGRMAAWVDPAGKLVARPVASGSKRFGWSAPGVTALRFSPDGRSIAYGDAEGGLTVAAFEGTTWRDPSKGGTAIRAIAWSGDGTELWVGDADRIAPWRLRGNQAYRGEGGVPLEQDERLSGLAILSDEYLVTLAEDGRFRIRERSGAIRADLVGHAGPVRQLVLGDAGDRCVSVGDVMVCAWGPEGPAGRWWPRGVTRASSVVGEWSASQPRPSLLLALSDGRIYLAGGELREVTDMPLHVPVGAGGGGRLALAQDRTIALLDAGLAPTQSEELEADVVQLALDRRGLRAAFAFRASRFVSLASVGPPGGRLGSPPPVELDAEVARIALADARTLLAVDVRGRVTVAVAGPGPGDPFLAREGGPVEVGSVASIAGDVTASGAIGWAAGLSDGQVHMVIDGETTILRSSDVAITAIALHLPDRLWTGDARGSVRRYDLRSRSSFVHRDATPIAAVGSAEGNASFAWNARGDRIAAADGVGLVVLRVGAPLGILETVTISAQRTPGVVAVGFSDDYLLEGMSDGSVWRRPAGVRLEAREAVAAGSGVIRALEAVEGGVVLALERATAGRSEYVLERHRHGELAHRLGPISSSVPVVGVGSTWAWVDESGRVVGHDVDAGETSVVAEALDGASPRAIACDAVGRAFVVIGRRADAGFARFIVPDRGVDRTLPLADPRAVSVTPNGRFAAISHGGEVGLFVVEAGAPLVPILGRKAKRLTWSPDGDRLAYQLDSGDMGVVEVRGISSPLAEVRLRTGLEPTRDGFAVDRVRGQTLSVATSGGR